MVVVSQGPEGSGLRGRHTEIIDVHHAIGAGARAPMLGLLRVLGWG